MTLTRRALGLRSLLATAALYLSPISAIGGPKVREEPARIVFDLTLGQPVRFHVEGRSLDLVASEDTYAALRTIGFKQEDIPGGFKFTPVREFVREAAAEIDRVILAERDPGDEEPKGLISLL